MCLPSSSEKKKPGPLKRWPFFQPTNGANSEDSCESSYCCFALWFTYAEVVFTVEKLSPGCQWYVDY